MSEASIFSNCFFERLSLAEIDISRHYQANMVKLETKYKLLINDLIEEKILIQQKLFQSFQTQMNQLYKLKLSMLQHGQLQECQASEQIVKQPVNYKQEKNNDIENNRATYKTQNPLLLTFHCLSRMKHVNKLIMTPMMLVHLYLNRKHQLKDQHLILIKQKKE